LAWILFAAAALCLLAAAHPFLTYPISLRILRRFRRAPLLVTGDSGASSSFSICVCAYNEAAVMERTIDNLLDLRRCTGDVQILVYVDGATDGTAEIARRYADSIDLIVSSDRRGKNHGLNRLSELARGDIMVMIDANTEIARDALRNLAKYFADPSVGCVCGHLAIVNSDETVTAHTGSLYWRLEERIKQLETETGSAMGADGSLYAIRRPYFHSIPHGLADDMYLSLAVLCDGHRVVRANDVRAFERSAPAAHEEFSRKVRIACQGFGAHLALWPKLRRLDALTIYKYLSHKVLRWFTALTLGCSVVFAFAGLGAIWGLPQAVVCAVGGGALLWAGTRAGLKPFTVIADVLQLFLATLIGVVRALNGTLVGTWEPATSVRNTGELG
jgi:glycosyltransferase involved in cell wall biosynthesis